MKTTQSRIKDYDALENRNRSKLSLMRTHKRRPSLAGFTLVELLIAIVILVVGAVGVLLVIPVAQKTSGRSALTTRAAILASEKLEELKAKGFTDLTSQPEWTGVQDEYSWKASITAVAATDFKNAEQLPADNFVKITMEITYKIQGKNRTDTFVTFYSEL